MWVYEVLEIGTMRTREEIKQTFIKAMGKDWHKLSKTDQANAINEAYVAYKAGYEAGLRDSNNGNLHN